MRELGNHQGPCGELWEDRGGCGSLCRGSCGGCGDEVVCGERSLGPFIPALKLPPLWLQVMLLCAHVLGHWEHGRAPCFHCLPAGCQAEEAGKEWKMS